MEEFKRMVAEKPEGYYSPETGRSKEVMEIFNSLPSGLSELKEKIQQAIQETESGKKVRGFTEQEVEMIKGFTGQIIEVLSAMESDYRFKMLEMIVDGATEPVSEKE